VLIREEMINLHHHHLTIPEVIQTNMMTIQMMVMMTAEERAAGRHAYLNNRLYAEICLQKCLYTKLFGEDQIINSADKKLC